MVSLLRAAAVVLGDGAPHSVGAAHTVLVRALAAGAVIAHSAVAVIFIVKLLQSFGFLDSALLVLSFLDDSVSSASCATLIIIPGAPHTVGAAHTCSTRALAAGPVITHRAVAVIFIHKLLHKFGFLGSILHENVLPLGAAAVVLGDGAPHSIRAAHTVLVRALAAGAVIAHRAIALIFIHKLLHYFAFLGSTLQELGSCGGGGAVVGSEDAGGAVRAADAAVLRSVWTGTAPAATHGAVAASFNRPLHSSILHDPERGAVVGGVGAVDAVWAADAVRPLRTRAAAPVVAHGAVTVAY